MKIICWPPRVNSQYLQCPAERAVKSGKKGEGKGQYEYRYKGNNSIANTGQISAVDQVGGSPALMSPPNPCREPENTQSTKEGWQRTPRGTRWHRWYRSPVLYPLLHLLRSWVYTVCTVYCPNASTSFLLLSSSRRNDVIQGRDNDQRRWPLVKTTDIIRQTW